MSITRSDKTRGHAVVPNRTGGGVSRGTYACGSRRYNCHIGTM